MHIRFSTCIGLPVVDDSTEHILGAISGILIHPDTGVIEGFFVRCAGLRAGDDLFCGTSDIVRWGTRVYIRSSDALAPPEDRIRLSELLLDPRSFLGQKIRTVSGTALGHCGDIQFDTERMHVEWFFPKYWFRYRVALPISHVVEVRKEAIVVRDPITKEPAIEDSASQKILMLQEMETRLG